MEVVQLLWATCSTTWLPPWEEGFFYIYLVKISLCFSFDLLPLVFSEELGSNISLHESLWYFVGFCHADGMQTINLFALSPELPE